MRDDFGTSTYAGSVKDLALYIGQYMADGGGDLPDSPRPMHTGLDQYGSNGSFLSTYRRGNGFHQAGIPADGWKTGILSLDRNEILALDMRGNHVTGGKIRSVGSDGVGER